MNSIQKINQINQKELENNVTDSASWHYDYKDTSYIFIGNLPFDLKEQDIVIIFSQYGIPTHINLIKDAETGKSRGFCYLKYEDHRSCVLAIDNFNGIKLFDRPLKVDHVYYKLRDDQNENDFLINYSECEKIIDKQITDGKEINKAKSETVLLEYNPITDKGNSDQFENHSKEFEKTISKNDDDDEFKDPMASFLSKKGSNEDDEFKDPMADFLSKDKDTKKHKSSSSSNGIKKRKKIEFKKQKSKDV